MYSWERDFKKGEDTPGKKNLKKERIQSREGSGSKGITCPEFAQWERDDAGRGSDPRDLNSIWRRQKRTNQKNLQLELKGDPVWGAPTMEQKRACGVRIG